MKVITITYLIGVFLSFMILIEDTVIQYQTKYIELKVDSLIVKNNELLNRNRSLVSYSDSLFCEIQVMKSNIEPDNFSYKLIGSIIIIILLIILYKLYENNK